jgi:hypothetical protein
MVLIPDSSSKFIQRRKRCVVTCVLSRNIIININMIFNAKVYFRLISMISSLTFRGFDRESFAIANALRIEKNP